AESKKLALKAQELLKKHPDKTGRIAPRIRENLAELAIAQNDLDAAFELYSELLSNAETSKGIDYDSETAAGALGRIELGRGHLKEAEALLSRVLESKLIELQAAFGQSERRQLQVSGNYHSVLSDYLSLVRRNGVAPNKAYRHVLAWKGLVLTRQRGLRRLRFKPELLPSIDRLEEINRELSRLPFRKQTVDVQQSLDRLTAEKDALEAQLNQETSYQKLKKEDQLTPEKLSELLPKDAMLIDVQEYFESPEYTGSRKVELRMAAFVLIKGQSVQFIDLGPSNEITSAIQTWRLRYGGGKESRDAGELLRDRLLRSETVSVPKSVKMLLFSPDAAWTQLPLSALPGLEKPYLIDEFDVAIVPTPRLLVEMLERESATIDEPSLLLIGNVDYETAVMKPNGNRAGLVRQAPIQRGGESKYRPLPGTRKEIESIAKSFRTCGWDFVSTHQMKNATEQAFRRAAARSNYIHLAVHGRFLRSKPSQEETGHSDGR
ncbi:MAG: CHAT domain-containing protein, partial [Planctomycetaceae bacterium]|nr:CHAT domain-containing protein [Planctomycetaceae bacterium]